MADNYAEFVNLKLRFLKKQTGLLHETVDDYVNEVSSVCQRWLDVREDKQMSFNEINTRLEHCIQYVTHNVEKISKETREDTESTQAVKETSTETKQPSSVSLPQASTPTSHSQPAVTGHDSENKMSTQVGFAAYVGGLSSPVPNQGLVIQSFTDIKCNLGKHFDPSTGTFTAPVAGMYVVSVTLRQLNAGRVHVLVRQKLSNPGPDDKVVCITETSKDETSSSGFSVVEMDAGDTICVKVWVKEGQVKLSGISSFSCFLVR